MAQPNIVREPSMDEILASIRRIIESNDSVTSSGFAAAMAEPAGFSGPIANDDGADDEAFQAGNDDHSNNPREPESHFPSHDTLEPATVASKSLSLADVAARVRAASERNGTIRQQKSETDVQMEAQQNSLMTSRMTVANAGALPSSVDDHRLPPPNIADDAGQAQDTALFDGVIELAAAEPILSPSIGDQVARSFDELTAALHFSGRRSFDEIAAELLRPMLQEWLDDNLPALVEKLVRGEIERVARGHRR